MQKSKEQPISKKESSIISHISLSSDQHIIQGFYQNISGLCIPSQLPIINILYINLCTLTDFSAVFSLSLQVLKKLDSINIQEDNFLFFFFSKYKLFHFKNSFLNGPNLASFCLLLFFSHEKYSTNSINEKAQMVCLGLNLGWQDLRRR